ncbi:MAG: transposase [Clostridia bacterium]|nr:transposase [Clostridia bacterium]
MRNPVRKRNRLPDFDYSTPNAYFLTICTAQRKNLLWDAVGATIGRPHELQLSPAGEIVQAAIAAIPEHYPACVVEHSVIMPNHVHLLLRIRADENGRPMVAPTVSTVVAQMKGVVTKRLGRSIWQKGFHDHIVRTENDFWDIWQYIEANPFRWAEDSLYTP